MTSCYQRSAEGYVVLTVYAEGHCGSAYAMAGIEQSLCGNCMYPNFNIRSMRGSDV